MAMLDLDDFPLHPSLRIPPLLDPFPDFTAKSDLPSPLEPNARLNADLDIETAKLTSRRKALAEAKPIGEPAESNDLRPIHRGPRKRQKLQAYERIADFVQLPKPKAAPKAEKPRPFQPVSVLNELHEPPPSAALFPPITPNETIHEHSQNLSALSLVGGLHGEDDAVPANRKVRHEGDTQSQKRVSQRPRTRWTLQETEQLQKGVEIYGIGKWKKILNHPEFSFQPGRTPVDLKDHHRTKLKSQASRKSCRREGQVSRTTDGFWHSVTNADSSSPPMPQKISDGATYAQQECLLSTGNNRKGTWTDIEDEHLEKGYKKYGFSWTRIAKDPELDLAHRTGPQVRDRFRTKFPALYGKDPRQHSRHGKESREKKEITDQSNEHGVRLKGALAGDKLSVLPKPAGSAESEKLALQLEQSRDDGGESDHNESNVEPIPESSPNRQSASASSTFNILGLLNSEGDDDRPSSELPLDTWDTNVTLPPLLWEEMATRPMFDLE